MSKDRPLPAPSSSSDVIYLDNEESEEDSVNAMAKMKNLLESWNLTELYTHLEEYGFDFYTLQIITEDNLTKIFHEPKFMGPLRKFKVMHAQWILSLKTSSIPLTTLRSQACSSIRLESAQENVEPSLNEVGESSSTLAEPPSVENSRPATPYLNIEDLSVFNLNNLLRQSEVGSAIINFYEHKKKLFPAQRKKLLKLIVDYLIKFKNRVSNGKIREISRQIAMVFPSENQEDYQKKDGKQLGLLQIAYNNRFAAIKKEKKKINEWRVGQSTESVSDENTAEFDDEIEDSLEWLKSNDPDCDDKVSIENLVHHWNNSFQYRLTSFSKKTFADIISEYPFLKKQYSFVLVESDFEKKYQRPDGLKSEWQNFCVANLGIMKEIITDPDIRQLLTNIDIIDGTNNTSSEFAKVLHGLAPPTSVTLNKKRWKPSTETSIECFFLNAMNKESMESQLRKKFASCDKKGLQYFPLIFGIGETEENLSEYVVAVHDVFYSFPTFIEAMDASFKCFIFYNISFPPQVKRFWSLINAIFYKIENSELKLSSSLSALLKSLD